MMLLLLLFAVVQLVNCYIVPNPSNKNILSDFILVMCFPDNRYFTSDIDTMCGQSSDLSESLDS